MKTINLELSKKLAPYLEDMKVEHIIYGNNKKIIKKNKLSNKELKIDNFFKTLTLEEVMDFLPAKLTLFNEIYGLNYVKMEDSLHIYSYENIYRPQENFCD